MYEQESNFPELIFLSEQEFSQPSFKPEIHSEHKEQTVPDTRQQEAQPQQNIEEDKKKRLRDDNTIFKTALSQFRKVLFPFIKVMKDLLKPHNQSDQIMKEINKKKNSATFLKFVLLSQKFNIKNEVKRGFETKMSKVLQRKKNKLTQKRFIELQKVYEKMKLSLECVNIKEAMEQYWGKYRQRQKFEKSEKEVNEFGQFLETINFKRQKINNKK